MWIWNKWQRQRDTKGKKNTLLIYDILLIPVYLFILSITDFLIYPSIQLPITSSSTPDTP